MPRSRIKSHLEHDTKRNFLLMVAGVAVIGILGVAFGPALIVQFSVLVQGKSDTNAQASQSNELMAPPLLETLPDATNSASLVIEGTALNGNSVQLFRNGRRLKETEIESDRVFRFIEVPLLEGKNTFKAKVMGSGKNESDFSESFDVIFDIKKPELSLDEPPDGQTFKRENNPIKVSGKTDPGTRVTINNFWAIVDDEGGYHYNLRLQNGENQITIIAVDEAGNKSDKQIKATLSE